MSGSALSSPAALAFVVIPHEVVWSYCVGGAVFAIGLAAIVLRGAWQRARGLDKLILFGPIFYAAPLAAFGTEHFTLTQVIASIVPKFIPWHMFWAYFVGACFIAAALSLVTGILTRLAASLLALNFFLFVVLMDGPLWGQIPHNRIIAILTLRELSFSAGALALAASLTMAINEHRGHAMATIARYVIAVGALFYSVQQFLHADHVPGVPLARLTPTWIIGHSVWTYFAAVAYAVTSVMLLAGKKTRAAATWLGATVLFIELVVYVPIAIVDRASLGDGLNYFFDTLMYCGAVLLLAGAMPKEDQRDVP